MKIKVPEIRFGDIKKQKRSIAALVVVVLALVVADLVWVAPIVDQKDALESKIKQQQEIISKYEQKLKQGKSIQEDLARQEGEVKDMQKKLFQGTDPYQLAASLGDLLSSKGSADGRKLEIKTYQVLASKEYGLYQEVHLRFNLMTSIDGLHYFLSRVRNSQFAILVQEINIQKIQRNKGPDLVVNVILTALMEKGEKS
ncbi:MAG: GspMb/PilO family protein [Syntrophobacteraceae bacterium]|jgi:Tfp pilus assembly protein PilO